MSRAIVFSIVGHKRMLAMFKKLPVKLRRKAILSAARIAMRPVLNAARANAPVEHGALKKTIKMRVLKRFAQTRGSIGIRVATASEWFTGDDFYMAFQEFGWRVGKRVSGYRHGTTPDTRREIPGKHYIEDAYKSHGEAAKNTFLTLMPAMIEKIAKER